MSQDESVEHPIAGWCWSTVQEVLCNHDYARIPVKAEERANRTGEYPYYGASGVIDTIDSYLFDGSYLLIGEDGANLLARSKPIAFQAHGKFWVNNHAHVLTTYCGMPLGYIENYFNLIDLAPYVTGTAQPKLPQAAMNKITVPVAPCAEQRRIVEAIESYFTRLEDAAVALERVERNLKRYRASVLKSAVEGRLVPTEAALAKQEGRDYEPASVLLERILTERRRRWIESGRKGKYQEPEFPDTKRLPQLPAGWCWATIDALIVGGPQNGIYVPKSQYGRGTPILRIDDYQIEWSRGSEELQRIEISDADAKTYRLRVNDIVINRVNSPSHLGKSMSVSARNVPAVFESNIMRMSLAAGVDARYVQSYLSSGDGKTRLIENAKWAVNQASINQGDVAHTAIPLPPVTEQVRIVAEVNRLLSMAQMTSAAAERNATRCHRLRQSILKWAFEGKLADQDPSDEPASVLLARIKAERDQTQPAKKKSRA